MFFHRFWTFFIYFLIFLNDIKLPASGFRPLDLALSLAGDMFGLLLERCNLLVARGEAGVVLEPGCQLEEDLCNLLAPVKVMCDWLLGNSDTWQPLVSSEPFAQLAQLATRLESIKAEVNNILDTCLSEKTFLAHPQGKF